MQGYYREPELTTAAFRDGYLCTGDMGELDEEGFLRITGRVKDIFKSAKGEYVTPTTIEFGFATNVHVEQVCVVGLGLPQPVALVVPSEIGLKLDKTALSRSLEATLLAINPVLKDYERLRKVIILQESWSVANGLMTPSLKIKRNVVEAKYQARLENWYTAKEMVVWE
jgi:long-chain acyl-CoA synthetase